MVMTKNKYTSETEVEDKKLRLKLAKHLVCTIYFTIEFSMKDRSTKKQRTTTGKTLGNKELQKE